MPVKRIYSNTKFKAALLGLFAILLFAVVFFASATNSTAATWTPTPRPTKGPWTPAPATGAQSSGNQFWNTQPTATKAWTAPATKAWAPTATPVAPATVAAAAQRQEPTVVVEPTGSPEPEPTVAPKIPTDVDYRVSNEQIPHTNVEITNRVAVGGVKNFGINIGKHDQFGASQILKNLIPNPGFESAEFSSIFLTRWGSKSTRVQPDNWSLSWNNSPLQIGHPAKFWNGSTYEILTGPAKGRTGTIEKFTHEDGFPTYYFAEQGRSPETGDVIVVRQNKFGYFQKRPNGYNQPDPLTTRPDSPGTQSLKLFPSENTYAASYIESFDSLDRDGDGSAGKLFLVNGQWRLEFWAKARTQGDKVRVTFRRVNERTFFDETIWLSDNWRKYTRTFNVDQYADRLNNPSPSPIVLEMRIPPGNGELWLDDIVLQRDNHTNPTAFSDKFVNRLLELEPGIIRDWGEQLGSSLDNQLAHQFARKTTGSSPLSQLPADFHYSLPEFLALAQHIKSEPWYVIPPTFSREELQNLMAYLGAPAGQHPYADLRAAHGQQLPWTTVFSTIHLEFGNEMWGTNAGDDQFIGATVRGGERLGEISNDRLGIMRRSPHFTPSKFDLVIGGQNGFPARQAEVEARSRSHDSIALAPYYGQKVDIWQSDAQLYYPIFAEAKQNATNGNLARSRNIINNFRRGTETSIYELNLHTTFGNLPTPVRNELVTGMGNGLALPLHMLTYQRDLGIRNQVAFTTLQYSFRLDNDGGFVRLWGMLRDLEATGRRRPAWLGMQLANQAIQGNAVRTEQTGKNPYWVQPNYNGIVAKTQVPFIQSFAFRKWNDYSLVLFNLNLQYPEEVRILLPDDIKRAPATVYTMSSPSIKSNNEFGEQVTIRQEEITLWDGYEMRLPPHSMVMIEFSKP